MKSGWPAQLPWTEYASASLCLYVRWTFSALTNFQIIYSESNNSTLDFLYNFDKCNSIYKILSLSNSWGNFVYMYRKDSPLMCFYTTVWHLTITIAADFNGIMQVRPQNSPCKVWGCLNSSGLNHMTINLENNATLLRTGSVMSLNCNWTSWWLTCNKRCSRQSLMKLAPVNDINVRELVLVCEIDIFST